MKKRISTWGTLNRKIQEREVSIAARLPQPPFHHHISLEVDGSLTVNEGMNLTPEEAAHLAKWLYDFYCGEEVL